MHMSEGILATMVKPGEKVAKVAKVAKELSKV